jgi:hypothetical protein
MDQATKDRINSCAGNDGCAPDLTNGKAIVDKVRQVQVSKGKLEVPHLVHCECGQSFQMIHYETSCPSCHMTYGVTPCSSHDSKNIKAAGIMY